MTLERRALGSQGLEVSALGLGCMGMSQSYGQADEAESLATLHRALELGCNFFDTAEVYGPHHNEELLGKAFHDRRDKVIIATKFGFKFVDGKKTHTPDSRPESIRRAVEGSLKRLRTDCIDLLYQHRVDPEVPIEDVAGAVADLAAQGKVRFLGLSEAGVDTVRRASAVFPVSAVQSEYSFWERNLEAEAIPGLRDMGVGLVPFSPLGRGFLTGTAKRAEDYPEDDHRHNDQRYKAENFEANVRATEALADLAVDLSATPAQVGLAWLLHKGRDIVPIPGTKRRTWLEQNLAAASLSLSASQMRALDEALPSGRVAGERYNEAMMATIDR